jgi:GT2 family glycosyltransferase
MQLQPPKWNTFIIITVLTVNIERCLETLYKYTEPGSFYVYIIDVSVRGIDANALRDKYKNLMVIRSPKSDVHYTGNLGFAKATNMGIALVETPYFTMLNDDVEMVNGKWWQGVLDTFAQVEKQTPDNPAVIVCPASIRLADWSVGRKAGDDFDILAYKEVFTEEDWKFLTEEKHYINDQLTIQPGSIFDGVTMYACVCDTRLFLSIGMLDEKYFVGSGEDYDYSCLARMKGYRSVATTKSWVWHHWSSTFRALSADKEEVKSLQIPELNWNQNHEKWGKNFDIWGVKCGSCGEQMRSKDGKTATCSNNHEVYTIPESTVMPL